MADSARNLRELLSRFTDQWQPMAIAAVNDYEVKLAKVQGDFIWHQHDDTDELFLVIDGTLTISLPGRDVELRAGELYVVPRGVQHCPRAQDEAAILLIEPKGTVNTGEAAGPRTTTVLQLD